jgi:hypothetical protein
MEYLRASRSAHEGDYSSRFVRCNIQSVATARISTYDIDINELNAAIAVQDN